MHQGKGRCWPHPGGDRGHHEPGSRGRCPLIISLFAFLVLMFFPASEVDTAHRVAGCESAGAPSAAPDRYAQNPTSSAAGYFQVLDSTWEWVRQQYPDIPPFEEARYNPVWNTYVASLLVTEYGGWAHWRWSQVCWG